MVNRKLSNSGFVRSFLAIISKKGLHYRPSNDSRKSKRILGGTNPKNVLFCSKKIFFFRKFDKKNLSSIHAWSCQRYVSPPNNDYVWKDFNKETVFLEQPKKIIFHDKDAISARLGSFSLCRPQQKMTWSDIKNAALVILWNN